MKTIYVAIAILAVMLSSSEVLAAQEGVGPIAGGITTPNMELYYEASSGGGYTNWSGQIEGTLSFWFKPNAAFGSSEYNTNKYFFEYYTPQDQFRLYTVGDLLWLQNITPSGWAQGNVSLAGSGFNFNDWNLITITWYPDSTVTRNFIYMNGAYAGTAFWSQAPSGALATDMGIGGRGFPGSGEAPCQGIIDELLILDVGLTTPQIAAMYNQMAVNKLPLSADANTLLLSHFDSSTTADFAAGSAVPDPLSTATITSGNQGYPFIPEPSMMMLGLAALLLRWKKK